MCDTLITLCLITLTPATQKLEFSRKIIIIIHRKGGAIINQFVFFPRSYSLICITYYASKFMFTVFVAYEGEIIHLS